MLKGDTKQNCLVFDRENKKRFGINRERVRDPSNFAKKFLLLTSKVNTGMISTMKREQPVLIVFSQRFQRDNIIQGLIQ